MLELSPHPLLVPALYLCGAGDQCRIDDELWERLNTGVYWARISAEKTGKAQRFRWRIERDA